MKNSSLINQVYTFITNNYKNGQPFFLKDLYQQLPTISEGTIRESIRRLINQDKILKAKNGVYELPNPNRILKSHVVNISNLVEQTYIRDRKNQIIGYRSGINFANALGLTSQTASVEVVYSNAVSNRKREIKLNNSRLIINAPRTEVTEKNYKLLQILDLLTEFERYSEYDLKQAESKIFSYISGLKLSRDELERTIEAYPLVTQVNFYKMGGANVITSR